jgi:hypothetical protein
LRYRLFRSAIRRLPANDCQQPDTIANPFDQIAHLCAAECRGSHWTLFVERYCD